MVDDTVPGKYRGSRNMDGAGAGAAIGESLEQEGQGSRLSDQDVQNNYSLAEPEGTAEDPDIAALYAKVNKPPKSK